MQEPALLGLTELGAAHTALSLVAIASGAWTFFRYREITTKNGPGRTYLVTTFLTAVTALFIFQRGSFGPGHVLAVMTLIALAAGMLAARTRAFGGASRVAQAIAFTSTAFFHTIPGFTEALTRLPFADPLLDSVEAPEFNPIDGALLALFAIGLFFQLRWIRRGGA
ncbi:MAG: hypothetical protein ACT4UP_03325 [Gammaproteobacteria bacterium]